MSYYPGFTAILGTTGVGKSTLLRWLIAREHRSNPELRVYANFKVYEGDMWAQSKPQGDSEPRKDPRVKPIRTLQAIKRSRNGLLALDQLGDWLGARNFGTEYNKKVTTIISDARKQDLILVYTDQYSVNVDIKIRNNVSLIYAPMGVLNRKESLGFHVFESTSGGSKPFAAFDLYAMGPGLTTPRQHTDLPIERIQEFFDTREQLGYQEEFKFRVKTHVKAVLRWAAKNQIDFGEMTYGSKRANDYLIRFEEERGKALTERQRARIRTEMDMAGIFKVMVHGKQD